MIETVHSVNMCVNPSYVDILRNGFGQYNRNSRSIMNEFLVRAHPFRDCLARGVKWQSCNIYIIDFPDPRRAADYLGTAETQSMTATAPYHARCNELMCVSRRAERLCYLAHASTRKQVT